MLFPEGVGGCAPPLEVPVGGVQWWKNRPTPLPPPLLWVLPPLAPGVAVEAGSSRSPSRVKVDRLPAERDGWSAPPCRAGAEEVGGAKSTVFNFDKVLEPAGAAVEKEGRWLLPPRAEGGCWEGNCC